MTRTTEVYVQEALKSYNSDCLRASAVMIGGAAETVILELRDALVARLQTLNETIPARLEDWRIKTVFDALRRLLDGHTKQMTRELREAVESFWPALAQVIRVARNDAGHPSDLSSVTEETVHAALLMFPELASLTKSLEYWVVSYQ